MRRLFSFAFWVLLVGAFALKIAEWTTENWWMASLGYGSVQLTYWTWRLLAFVPACALWAGVMGASARLAWHNAHWRDVSLPLLGPRGFAGRGSIPPEDRARLDVLARRGARAFIALSALLCGVAAANRFDLWVLALGGGSWGAREASSGQDIGFFVWVLPALGWACNALGTLLFFTLGLVAAIAAFEGVLDFDTRGLRIGDATARHLAFLGALLLGWIGARSGIAMLHAPINLGWSPGGISGFYDRTFAQPARALFLLSALPLAFWFARAATRRFGRALLVAGAWTMGALFLPLMAPSFGRAVWPQSPSLDALLRDEARAHIETTRRAWDLDRVETRSLDIASSDFVASSRVSPQTGAALPVVAWPREALGRALDANNTDSNRVPGDVFVARENQNLVARVIEVNPFAAGETSALALSTDPSKAGTVLARRETFAAVVLAPKRAGREGGGREGMGREGGAPGPDAAGIVADGAPAPAALTREVASGAGVVRENAWQGLALAARWSDRSLLVAGPPLTWHLDPLERVETLAPMVFWEGARPHAVWMPVPGDTQAHLFWLVEGCFTSRSFPGAAMASVADEWSGINYARQSVLGVCDATTGDTTFYGFDPQEPFMRAWNTLLPGFFRPVEELAPPLRAGTRLSRPLIGAQCSLWTRYHTARDGGEEALAWRERGDDWRVLTPDTSERDRLDQTVLLGRDGRQTLNSLAAFAPGGGTLSSTGARSQGETIPLIALLSAGEEGEELWKLRGHARRVSWRASLPIAMPGGNEQLQVAFPSPLSPQLWQKLALHPELDERGDITGLSLLRGDAALQSSSGHPQWTLEEHLSSTIPARVETASSPREGANLARLRVLWSAWKSARAQGRWARVESLEAELNRLLAP